MATPDYNGVGYRRGGWGHGRNWGQTPGPTDNGWLDRVGSWLGGSSPPYAGAGQPTSGMVGSGTPVYQPAPPMTATAGAVTTAPQVVSPVIVVPRT
jgi:hypothetical protein